MLELYLQTLQEGVPLFVGEAGLRHVETIPGPGML